MTCFKANAQFFSSAESQSSEEVELTLPVMIERYGAMIFQFLEPLEALRLQGLNYWLHLEGIAISQPTWKIVKRQRYYYFTNRLWPKLRRTILIYDAKLKKSKILKNKIFDFTAHSSVQVGQDLYTVAEQSLTVFKYFGGSNITKK